MSSSMIMRAAQGLSEAGGRAGRRGGGAAGRRSNLRGVAAAAAGARSAARPPVPPTDGVGPQRRVALGKAAGWARRGPGPRRRPISLLLTLIIVP